VRVSHYFEWEDQITGGHAQSVRNQRTMLSRLGVDYTTSPDLSADLLHLNNMGPRSILYARRARDRDVPVLVHAHQTAEDFRESFALSNLVAPALRPYLSYAYGLADHLVCPSEHTARVLDGYCDTPRTVVSNGFDPAKLAGHDDPDLRATYLDRYDLEPPVVFMVGHVIERKGLAAFVETARRLPETEFAWFGYLNPGGGTVDRVLRSRTTTKLVNGSPPNCTFTGYVDDVAGAFAAGDVFFFPTKNENEGMALLEAMATGAPPVVRDIETFGWLEGGETALKARDVAGFVAALRSLLRDPHRRAAVGASAAAASAAYELDAVAEDLRAAYEAVLGRPVAPER
jgi:glycosyltransferase involved in cell wall biosynthesis